MQPDAVAEVPFLDGITFPCVVELEAELELELLEEELLEEEPGGGRQGGTIRVVTLLFAGSTSCSCGVAPACAPAAAPPGVIRIVLAGGGAIASLELELDELLELELLPGEPHGSIATVCVSELFGIEIRLEPGGTALLPCWETTAASEQEVTAIVIGLCCLGMTTVRVPGLVSAAATGSMLELDEEPPPLLPQADSTTAEAAHVMSATARRLLGVWIVILSSRGPPGAAQLGMIMFGRPCMHVAFCSANTYPRLRRANR